ncbi:hypothetical protein H4Q26_003115 [Puccinia striiformis f. sp. tritici PST-130]|nr:hypothetical protein H4Q26_003115 [Puccinia striiformis f. sp. tritici PST-130]
MESSASIRLSFLFLLLSVLLVELKAAFPPPRTRAPFNTPYATGSFAFKSPLAQAISVMPDDEHLSQSKTGCTMFFWFIPADDVRGSRDLTIWANGDACSRLVGAFQANGPITMNQGRVKPTKNPTPGPALHTCFTWIFRSMLASVVAESLSEALTTSLVFPEMEGLNLYMAGHAYSGTYISYAADKIYAYQSQLTLKLQGILLVNAFISTSTLQQHVPIASYVVELFPNGDASPPATSKVLPNVIQRSKRVVIAHGVLDATLLTDGHQQSTGKLGLPARESTPNSAAGSFSNNLTNNHGFNLASHTTNPASNSVILPNGSAVPIQGTSANTETPLSTECLLKIRKYTKDQELAQFLLKMEEYKPVIPDEVAAYYLQRVGFDMRSVMREQEQDNQEVGQGPLAPNSNQLVLLNGAPNNPVLEDRTRTVLTQEDLAQALAEYGINASRAPYYLELSLSSNLSSSFFVMVTVSHICRLVLLLCFPLARRQKELGVIVKH